LDGLSAVQESKSSEKLIVSPHPAPGTPSVVDLRFFPCLGLQPEIVRSVSQEAAMLRERALKVVLVVVGVLFTAGIYPLAMRLLHPQKCEYSDVMMLSLYVTLGIFLLIAVRSASAYRSLIAFAAWSSLAHAIVMGVQALPNASMRGDLYGSAALVVIGLVLLALAPTKQSAVAA
jgi:hypothetical protein